MKIIYNNMIPFRGFLAINLLGILFVRKEYKGIVNARVLNHESIHTRQMKELLYVFFYILYVAEWLVRLFLPGNAYHNISFEREAYINEECDDYLQKRKRFAFTKFLILRE